MSIHSSLKVSGAGRGTRNVWSRIERLAVLKREGLWTEDSPVVGLPKVRTRFKTKTKKQAKADAPADGAAAPAAGAAAAAAAPAAGAAKPAAKPAGKK